MSSKNTKSLDLTKNRKQAFVQLFFILKHFQKYKINISAFKQLPVKIIALINKHFMTTF